MPLITSSLELIIRLRAFVNVYFLFLVTNYDYGSL